MKQPHEITGLVSRVQRFCLDDGPGIRSTVFLKGCPLTCAWCHNPENQRYRPELSYLQNLCLGCQSCSQGCPGQVHSFDETGHHLDFEKCQLCGLCAQVCPASAVYVDGKTMTVQEVLRIVECDRAFYGKEGGVTLSGGEPLSQPEFAEAVFRGAKERGLHTAAETCGFWTTPPEKWLDLVDLWLYDFKAGPSQKHRALCGVGTERIHENLLTLARLGANILIRYPVVPGVNAEPEDLEILAELIRKTQRDDIQVELLGYHVMGAEKSRRIGKSYPDFLPTKDATDEEVAAVRSALEKLGVRVKVSK